MIGHVKALEFIFISPRSITQSHGVTLIDGEVVNRPARKEVVVTERSSHVPIPLIST
jgi:hypothetical protein